MRRPILAGVGASLATTIAAFSLSLALAAGIMNLTAVRDANNDLQVNWQRHTNASVEIYDVVQCSYVSAPALKCSPVASVPNASAEFTITIPNADVLPQATSPNAVVKVIAKSATGEVSRENVRIYPLENPTPTPPAAETIPLGTGCQQNIAVGVFPDAVAKAVVDAGGTAFIFKPGSVYEVVLKGRGVHEDDERLVDLRDFERECRVYLP